MPPPLSRGGLGIAGNFISSPEAPLQGELAGASPTERLYEGEASSLPQYLHLRPSPDGLGRIDLRPAGAESVGGGFGFGFGAEHAEDRRAAAGHEGGDGSVLPEGGLDGLVVLSAAALLEGVSGSGADSVQVARPDGGFLRTLS